MYLKQLELQGFKSFPEKIRLEFNKGITAVVGPNGSGKSNVSDAVRWVLGESSVKNLRGSKMEDVIFAGTSSRRALGFAEVSMIMDNEDGKVFIDFNEITITRRVYRSGESQFLINGTACRLKDIRELFMDTGIGREGYSIIGQGRVEEILSAKSEDRRLLFEEAAGIVKFKNRKHEAENKLDKEKQNLVRVDDIIFELNNQIEPLERASSKAKRFLAATERLKLIKVNIFLQQIQKTIDDTQRLDMQLEDLFAQIMSVETEQTEQKSETEKFKRNLSEVISGIECENNIVVETRSNIEQKQGEIKLLVQQIGHNIENRERILKEISSRKESEQVATSEISIHQSKLSAVQLETLTLSSELKEAEADFLRYSERLSESESLIDKYSSTHIDRLQETSDIKSNLQRSQILYEQLENRQEELLEEINFTKTKIYENEIKMQSTEKTLKDLFGKIEFLESQNDKLAFEREELEREIAEIDSILQQALKQLSASTSRCKILKELESSYEGYYKSVKSVLKEKARNPEVYKGIHGAVGELISVSEKYETAIEISLGGAIQDIITESESDAQIAIEHLKHTKTAEQLFFL